VIEIVDKPVPAPVAYEERDIRVNGKLVGCIKRSVVGGFMAFINANHVGEVILGRAGFADTEAAAILEAAREFYLAATRQANDAESLLEAITSHVDADEQSQPAAVSEPAPALPDGFVDQDHDGLS
jgi:hypothetical protein